MKIRQEGRKTAENQRFPDILAHVDVPKDLNGIRTTFIFGMSGKQLMMLCLGALLALGLTALLRGVFGLTLFAGFLIAITPTLAPIAFCAFYRKNGMSCKKVAEIVLRQKVRRKPLRLYKTNNFYSQLAGSNALSSCNNGKEGINDANAAKKTTRQQSRNKKR